MPAAGCATFSATSIPNVELAIVTDHISLIYLKTRSSAIADGPRDAIVSTNPADARRRHIPRLT